MRMSKTGGEAIVSKNRNLLSAIKEKINIDLRYTKGIDSESPLGKFRNKTNVGQDFLYWNSKIKANEKLIDEELEYPESEWIESRTYNEKMGKLVIFFKAETTNFKIPVTLGL